MNKQTEKHTEKTKVIFRKLPDGEIIALFPELPGTNDPATCLSYMHARHGSASGLYVLGKPAAPEESATLARELAGIGYIMETIKRFPATAYETRKRLAQS